jgi:hypothetical protein
MVFMSAATFTLFAAMTLYCSSSKRFRCLYIATDRCPKREYDVFVQQFDVYHTVEIQQAAFGARKMLVLEPPGYERRVIVKDTLKQ